MMNRERAIEEVEWYRQLVIRKLRAWGRDLHPETQRLLVENMDDVATRRDVLQYKEYADGYYIGQLDEDKRRHGYGIFTRTTKIRDRWTMQAGFWHDDRAMGTHTFYDSDCPQSHHYLAAIYFRGEKRREQGSVEVSISERGIDSRPRKYRSWEGFSFTTLLVGGLIIYVFLLATIRNARLSLYIVGFIAALYLLGSLRGRD